MLAPPMAPRMPKSRRGRARRAAGAGLALALLATGPAAGAAGSPGPWSEGPVTVRRMRSPCFLELAREGERVPFRVTGVDCVGPENPEHREAALRAARRWVGAGPVRVLDAQRGERGELLGELRLHDGSLLGERLLANGYGVLLPEALPEERSGVLALAQRNARDLERGLWGDTDLDAAEVKKALHGIATVCGGANAALRQADGGYLLYVGRRYPQRDLGVRIPGEFRERFQKPERAYLQHEICVTGRIEPTTIAAEMVLTDPAQIEVGGFTQ